MIFKLLNTFKYVGYYIISLKWYLISLKFLEEKKVKPSFNDYNDDDKNNKINHLRLTYMS